MNNMRRQKLYDCSSMIGLASDKLELIKEKLQELLCLKEEIDLLSRYVSNTVKDLDKIYDEESKAYDSLPDNLQYSDIGMGIDLAMGRIEDAKDDAEQLLQQLDSLEESYYQFLGSYKPEDFIGKLETVVEEFVVVKESILKATINY